MSHTLQADAGGIYILRQGNPVKKIAVKNPHAITNEIDTIANGTK